MKGSEATQGDAEALTNSEMYDQILGKLMMVMVLMSDER